MVVVVVGGGVLLHVTLCQCETKVELSSAPGKAWEPQLVFSIRRPAFYRIQSSETHNCIPRSKQGPIVTLLLSFHRTTHFTHKDSKVTFFM